MTSKLPSILVIDDERDVGELISATAEAMGLACTVTTEALPFLDSVKPDISLILLDLVMPEMDGIELLRKLGDRRCRARIVLMSGVGKRILETAEKLAQSLGLSIAGHLQKPFSIEQLEAMLRKRSMPEAAENRRRSTRIFIHDDELRASIDKDEFALHYQPQIELASGEVIGVEALVRWQHPERGLIFPDDFIARTEALGLIDRLGILVANRALAEVAQLADPFGALPTLSLNFSVYSLYDLRFPDVFLALVGKYGVPASKVVLEITESGLIKELSSTLDVLTRLRMREVQLSIDDFGTGYAMMQQLRLIPSTELKIDKSIVQNMHCNESDRVMVHKMIEIGHELEMRVTAEGVETEEQLAFLRAQGCDLAQGYLFSRALPLKDLVEWLELYRAGMVPPGAVRRRPGHGVKPSRAGTVNPAVTG